MHNPFESLKIPRDIGEVGKVVVGLGVTAISIPASMIVVGAIKLGEKLHEVDPKVLDINPFRNVLPKVVTVEQ